MQCSIETEIGSVDLTFRVTYAGSGGGLTGYDYVIKDNYTTHASIWWGTRLIDAYWNGIMSVMSETQRMLDGLVMRANFDYLWNNRGPKRYVGRRLGPTAVLTVSVSKILTCSIFRIPSSSRIR